jgi:hypothetical protein
MVEDFRYAVLADRGARRRATRVISRRPSLPLTGSKNFEERGNVFKKNVNELSDTLELTEIFTELCSLSAPPL